MFRRWVVRSLGENVNTRMVRIWMKRSRAPDASQPCGSLLDAASDHARTYICTAIITLSFSANVD